MHGVKFRIQDCPGFPYMGRDVQKLAGVMPLGTLTTRTATRTSKKKNKKTIGLISKTTLHVHYPFFHISLPALHDYDVKMPNFVFYGARKQATTKFCFSFCTWIYINYGLDDQ